MSAQHWGYLDLRDASFAIPRLQAKKVRRKPEITEGFQMPGNHRSGPRKSRLPGLLPGGVVDGVHVNPIKDAMRYEDLKVPLDVLDVHGARFYRHVGKILCNAGEMHDSFEIPLELLAYTYQCIARRERAGLPVTQQMRGVFRRELAEFGLNESLRPL